MPAADVTSGAMTHRGYSIGNLDTLSSTPAGMFPVTQSPSNADAHAPATPQAAGFPRRLGALLYDCLLLVAVLILATAVALIALQGRLDYTSGWFRLYLLAAMFAFEGGFWTHGGQTLGMRAWKIRLESTDGSPVRWWQALIRFVVAVGSLGAGLLWALVDRDKQALYDYLARTRLVRISGG